jgi:methyltransferase of ATP-grasp peptide maturase system
MTTTALPWGARARGLADRLCGDGVLRDPAWRTALEGTPRHVFVPSFYRMEHDVGWAEIGTGQPAWLEAVYSDLTLVTALADKPVVPVSSATRPGLLMSMLEALDVHDGHRMLEIGTGTGFGTAVLCHRLGADNVFSVDISANLVEAARERLAGLGYAPTLTVGHGALGLPGREPFDRIMATCSVPAVPWAWAEQLAPGGRVLVDVKPGFSAGSLVLLRRYEDRLEGRFLPEWAAFVAMRDADSTPHEDVRPTYLDEGAISSTRLEPKLDGLRVPWFLAHSLLPQVTAFGSRGEDEPEWVTFAARDGSWCEVGSEPDHRGFRRVRQGGPIRIWDRFERAHRQWQALGEPGWDRLGLTVTPDGFHRVWLDDPDGDYRWPLPPLD